MVTRIAATNAEELDASIRDKAEALRQSLPTEELEQLSQLEHWALMGITDEEIQYLSALEAHDTCNSATEKFGFDMNNELESSSAQFYEFYTKRIAEIRTERGL